MFFAHKSVFVQVFAQLVKKQGMTTHVRVMYVLSKHVHALNLLATSIVIDDFSEHVRVWRLILKKNSPWFFRC